MSDKLTVYYQNCRGIRTKLNILYMNILANCYDIIVLSETWLTPNIADNEFIDERYVIYRCDRNRMATNKKEGGGVLVAVLKNLHAFCVPLVFSNSFIEHILVQIPGDGHEKHFISAAYIPPKTPDEIYIAHFGALQSVIGIQNNSKFYLFGDYNLPDIEWLSNVSDTTFGAQNCHGSTLVCRHIDNFMSLHNASQFNSLKNSMGRILDLIISNNNCTVHTPSSVLLPIDSYHPPFITMICYKSVFQNLRRAKTFKYNFYKADYDKINHDLDQIDWCSVFEGVSAGDSVNVFYDKVFCSIKNHTPKVHTRSSKFPVWFSRSLIRIFNNKNRAWIKWKMYCNISDYEQFSYLRRRFRSECVRLYNNYMITVEDNVNKNVKYLWSYIKSRKTNCSIPSFITYKNQSTSDPYEICNLFSDFFYSVYENSTFCDSNWFPPDVYADNCVLVSSISFSIEKVLKALKSVDITKGSGPDGIPPYFLKKTSDYIYIPLHIIYNKCITEGHFPDIWKRANITPVHKTGPRHTVENYRPISILSSLSKLFERLVYDEIYPILHTIIIKQQHGFVKKRSTTTNLLIFTDYLFNSMDQQVQVDAVYTDFRKAFDKVDHELLLNKISYNGIRGDLLRWFISYVTNRTQKVVIQGFESATIKVASGVPQGSILGPLLFILFVNDIDKCFRHSKFLLYADDLKIFRNIRNITDCQLFQEDLDRFTLYCLNNKIQLSIEKCLSITFTKNKNKNIISNIYTLNCIALSSAPIIRDLGVLLDSKLHLDQHIDKIVSNAYRMYGFVMRSTINFKRTSTYIHLYKALIRSQLEYAVLVWSPYYRKYIDILEKVQCKFLKATHYRCFRSTLTYSDLLNYYKLTDLRSRRTFLETIFLYDICNNRYDCLDISNKLCYIVPRTVIRREVRARPLFAVPSCRTNAGVRAPMRRLAQNYNTYFSNIDLYSSSTNKFRKELIQAIKGLDN